ncbi:MAG: GAF domain-containing protein, partial [Chloroflexales bacterium]|nr:GAF domain-containing protein [Chloroflexales bacterium]
MNRSLSRLTVRSALTPMRVHGQGEQRLARLIQLLLLVIVSLVVVRVPRAPEPGLLSILGLVWLTYGGLHCARLGLAPRLRRRLANLRARASAPAAREASRSDPDVSAPHTPLDFRALADHALVGIFVTTLEGEWRYANAALAQLLEYASPAALMQQNARELYQQPAARAALLSRLRRGEPVRNAKLELRTQGGALRTVLASVTLEGDQITGMLIDSTERARAEARKSASRTRSVEAERAAQGQRFLTEASMLLGSTLDYDATLAGLARLAVPRLADWCLIHLRGSDGLAHIVAFEHADPCRQALRPDLCRWYTLTPEAPSHIAQVLRRGTPLLVAEIREEHLQAAAVDADHLAALRQLGMRSGLIVPLIAQQDCIGALTLIAAESGRQYDATDLALAEELARRAAQAITHARLYAAEQQARAAAEAAVQLRDEFLSVAAHELQTPLA